MSAVADLPLASSPRRRRNRSAQAWERLAGVAHLASLVGHKARNRLALVRAGLELLTIGAEAALTPEHRSEILRQFDRFLGDFNLGLDLMRCDFGRPEAGSLSAALTDAIEAYRPQAEAAGMAIHSAFGRRGPEETAGDDVFIDQRLLRLVLLNLLRNAQEAGAKAVTVKTAFRPGTYTIDVRDDGPGVAPEVVRQLFREPVTTRPDGTGLGLVLCRDAMAAMDGKIRLLRSRSGAAFLLTFVG